MRIRSRRLTIVGQKTNYQKRLANWQDRTALASYIFSKTFKLVSNGIEAAMQK